MQRETFGGPFSLNLVQIKRLARICAQFRHHFGAAAHVADQRASPALRAVVVPLGDGAGFIVALRRPPLCGRKLVVCGIKSALRIGYKKEVSNMLCKHCRRILTAGLVCLCLIQPGAKTPPANAAAVTLNVTSSSTAFNGAGYTIVNMNTGKIYGGPAARQNLLSFDPLRYWPRPPDDKS